MAVSVPAGLEGRMGREWHQRACSLNSDLAARTGCHDPVQPRHRHPPKGYTSPGGRLRVCRAMVLLAAEQSEPA